MLFILVAYAGRNLGCTWIILAILVVFFSGIAALYYTRPRTRLYVAKAIEKDGELKGSKIVPLTTDTILEHKN
jgi:hypothetical protein